MHQEYLEWARQWIQQEDDLKLLFQGEIMVAASPAVGKLLPTIHEGDPCDLVFGDETPHFRGYNGTGSVFFSGKFAGNDAEFLISGRQELTLVQIRLQGQSVPSNVLRAIGEELEGPLTTIQAVIPKILPEVEETDRNLRMASQVNRSLYKIIRLEQNLMTAARLDTAIRLNLRPVFICSWLEDLGEELTPYVEASGRRLKVKISRPKTGDYGCMIDQSQMKRVILNLVSNSLKFTEAGGELELRLKKAASGCIHIVLKDNGCGITPQDMAKVFRRMERTELISSPQWGSGLGLLVARGIVQAHGGNLLVQSEPGKGTVVHVMLEVLPGKQMDTVNTPVVVISGGFNNILVELVDALPDDYYDCRGINL